MSRYFPSSFPEKSVYKIQAREFLSLSFMAGNFRACPGQFCQVAAKKDGIDGDMTIINTSPC
jgi:hypothetical protein